MTITGPAVAIYGPISTNVMVKIMKAFETQYRGALACDATSEEARSIGATMVLIPKEGGKNG